MWWSLYSSQKISRRSSSLSQTQSSWQSPPTKTPRSPSWRLTRIHLPKGSVIEQMLATTIHLLFLSLRCLDHPMVTAPHYCSLCLLTVFLVSHLLRTAWWCQYLPFQVTIYYTPAFCFVALPAVREEGSPTLSSLPAYPHSPIPPPYPYYPPTCWHSDRDPQSPDEAWLWLFFDYLYIWTLPSYIFLYFL